MQRGGNSRTSCCMEEARPKEYIPYNSTDIKLKNKRQSYFSVRGEERGSPGKSATGSGFKGGFWFHHLGVSSTGLFVNLIELYTFLYILYFKKNLSKVGDRIPLSSPVPKETSCK